jgi:hypothetical protein
MKDLIIKMIVIAAWMLVFVMVVVSLSSCGTTHHTVKRNVRSAWQPFNTNDGCGAGKWFRPTAMW